MLSPKTIQAVNTPKTRTKLNIIETFAIFVNFTAKVTEAIATALTQLDDDGSVQFGVWLGVIGHVFYRGRAPSNQRNLAPTLVSIHLRSNRTNLSMHSNRASIMGR